MKKVININFQGRVVMIEEEAYEKLKTYIESLRKHFANEEGSDEIINDIENRISELFAEVIKKGNPCVSESDLEAVISSIGRPEDFEDEEAAPASTTTGGTQEKQAESQSQSSSQQTNTEGRRQFFRDENNKKLGGVCSGLANFFNVDVTWIRLFSLVLLVFYGVGVIPYIILWIAVPSSATQVIGSSHKRLYRDLSHKTIGGVCAGLANYFGVSIWVPKVIFLMGAICSFPIAVSLDRAGGFLFPGINGFFVTIYIILWAVVPAAVTASEKLSMKGESVDLNSIKNTVQEDLNDGKKSKKKINDPTMSTTNSQDLIPVKDRSTLGDIIATLFKVFAYFILGCILLAIICALGGVGIAAFGILPFKGYIIGGTWQNTLAILTVVLGVWLPVIGIIIWIIRSLTKAKRNIYLRVTFIALWLVGVMSFVGLILSVRKDVLYDNSPVAQKINLYTPKQQNLEINYVRLNRPFRFSRHWIFGRSSYSINRSTTYHDGVHLFDNVPYIEDSALVNNTNLQFIPSKNDSLSVDIIKYASGSSSQYANQLAEKINYAGISQQDSVLNIPSFFSLNQTDKFRNQFVNIRIYVPIGKKITIHQNEGYSNKIFLGFPFLVDDDDYYDFDNDWNFNEEYIMTKDGLKETHVHSDDRDDDDDNAIINSHDSIEAARQRIEKQQKDLDKEKERLQKMNDEKKQNLEKQLQELKQDSGAKSTVTNVRFESPLLLLGKAFIKVI